MLAVHHGYNKGRLGLVGRLHTIVLTESCCILFVHSLILPLSPEFTRCPWPTGPGQTQVPFLKGSCIYSESLRIWSLAPRPSSTDYQVLQNTSAFVNPRHGLVGLSDSDFHPKHFSHLDIHDVDLKFPA